VRNFNWKILNAALWIEVLLTYLLPFQVTDDFQYQAGFPMSFITVYDTKIGVNPFMSMHLNPMGLLFDAIVIHLILLGCIRLYQKWRVK
jgi:hypothetical protein